MNDSFVVSVTRFRVRSVRFLPFFLIHAQRCLVQIRRADGHLGSALRHDRDLSYWTASVWRDETALRSYVTMGAHRTAMPQLSEWSEEASTVRWRQANPDLPRWALIIERMRADGCAVPVRHPGPAHADLSFAASEPAQMARI